MAAVYRAHVETHWKYGWMAQLWRVEFGQHDEFIASFCTLTRFGARWWAHREARRTERQRVRAKQDDWTFSV